MRCGKMRCGNIRRCGGPKSFYSQLIALGQKTKSGEAVLNKLNENPELSGMRLQNEGHLFCENGGGGAATKLAAPDGPFGPAGCGMCKNGNPQSEEDVCYDFEGNGDSYSFIIVPTDAGGGINYTRGAPSSSDLPPFIWIMAPCQNPELLEFEQLIDLNSADDILEELNAAPEAYFNKYNAEGHITPNDVLAVSDDCDTEGCLCFYGYYFYFTASRGAQSNKWYKDRCGK